MFCFGIIGFLAGILVQKGLLPRKRWALCLFGGVATVVVYGGIINVGSVIMFSGTLTWKAVLAAYASGFPFDLVHAGATVFFLFVLANPMMEKIQRIQIKYGLLEPEESGDSPPSA